MDSRILRWIVAALGVIAVVGGLAWQSGVRRADLAGYLPADWQARLGLAEPAPAPQLVRASGIIQADEIHVATEFGGTITAMYCAAGETVRAGDALAALDTAVLDAQIVAADAALALAEAALAQARAGARPTAITVAEAELAQAQANVAAAGRVVSDTLALLENPQELRLQIAVTQAQLNAAGLLVGEAVANKDALELAKNKFEEVSADWGDGRGRQKALVSSGSLDDIPADLAREIGNLADGVYSVREFELHISGGGYELYKWVPVDIPLALHLTPNQWWQAWVGVNAAAARQEGLRSSLGQLYTQLNNPQAFEASVSEALAAVAQAEAGVQLAQAQLDGLRAGASPEQINLLTERVHQSQGALDILLAQRERLFLPAMIDGVVIDRVLHPGEVAAPGATVLTLARLDDLRLRVFVPERHFARIALGQAVEVAVDSFPARRFVGAVAHIADQAEFTPRNVTTTDERALLVFAVDIVLPNESGTLRPGMPADAVFVDAGYLDAGATAGSPQASSEVQR